MNPTIRLVQLTHSQLGRQVALVEEPQLLLLNDTGSIFQLALDVINIKKNITAIIRSRLSNIKIDYNDVYEGRNDWRLLPSFDHPGDPFACLVSGTGLTHKTSALNRQMMHQAEQDKLTDSMKIYQWGLEGGQPENGKIGVQPEWFYKGSGLALKAHRDILEVPAYANDGGEEPEVAGVYVIDGKGEPYRIGFTTGNEFSDHIMERKNYLYLAPSKLRNCAIGPELVIGAEFKNLQGTVSILRQGTSVWTYDIKTGENHMAHSLANLEYHHFKYNNHRIPFQAHVHFFGADAFSFGKGIRLENDDVMQIQWNGFGRSLQNRLFIQRDDEKWLGVKSIEQI
jgi:hypothetical protein